VTVEQPAAPAKINQVAYWCRALDESQSLAADFELEDPESALILFRRTAAELTNQLQAAGYSADEYHSDLTQQARERLLGRFREAVLGSCHGYRGVDVDHMTHVINYDLPDSGNLCPPNRSYRSS